MLIVHGKYFWGRKKVGYRSDYCLSCEAETFAEQFRTFDVGHIYWIPLLPLGFRKRWVCIACGNDPHSRTQTSKTLIVILAVLVGFMSALSWTPPLVVHGSDASMIWTMRFVFPAALAGLIYWIQRSKPPTDLKEKLAAVRPLSDTECPYCKGALDREGHCAACQVTHRRILNYQRGE